MGKRAASRGSQRVAEGGEDEEKEYEDGSEEEEAEEIQQRPLPYQPATAAP